jgi:hypothetical protein
VATATNSAVAPAVRDSFFMAAAATVEPANNIEVINFVLLDAAQVPRFIKRQADRDGDGCLWAKLNCCEYL